jgi:hypothetical protein
MYGAELHAAEQRRPDIAAAREIWRTGQSGLNPDRLVFIDETWATTNMTRLRGRAPRGQRVVAAVPHGHSATAEREESDERDQFPALPCLREDHENRARATPYAS